MFIEWLGTNSHIEPIQKTWICKTLRVTGLFKMSTYMHNRSFVEGKYAKPNG